MDIAALLTRGGVWYNIPGKTSADFISTLVSTIKVTADISRDDLAQACARREASSSTAMGRGLAFPHPGNPMAKNADEAIVVLAYPRFPVDWKAPDGAPVKAVFMIVSASRPDHLATLSGLARLCGDDAFYTALSRQASLAELVGIIGKSAG